MFGKLLVETEFPLSKVDVGVDLSLRQFPINGESARFVLIENPDDVESWEIMLDAIRHEPDPARLDRFLIDLPGEPMKRQLSP